MEVDDDDDEVPVKAPSKRKARIVESRDEDEVPAAPPKQKQVISTS